MAVWRKAYVWLFIIIIITPLFFFDCNGKWDFHVSAVYDTDSILAYKIATINNESKDWVATQASRLSENQSSSFLCGWKDDWSNWTNQTGHTEVQTDKKNTRKILLHNAVTTSDFLQPLYWTINHKFTHLSQKWVRRRIQLVLGAK